MADRLKKSYQTILILLLFISMNIIIYGESLSNVSGISNLSNYSKIKNIESKKILDFDTQIVLNDNLVYEKESKKLFTGIAVQKINDKIKNINFYEKGKLTYFYKYYLDGNIEEMKEIDGNEVVIEKYDKNKKLSLRRVFENGILKEENQYSNGKKVSEYIVNDEKTGKYVYYDGKKVVSEMEVEQITQNKNIYQLTNSIKTYGRNGKVEREYNFKNGSIEGQIQKIYHSNGQIKYAGIAENNNLVEMQIKDLFQEFNRKGHKITECKELENEKWNCEFYNDDGKIKNSKTVNKNFSEIFSTKKYIYDSEPGMDFLRALGQGIIDGIILILQDL